MDDSKFRIYKIKSLSNEFRGGQLLDASNLSSLENIGELLLRSDLIGDKWPKPDFHSVGPPFPKPALFSIHRTSTLAYYSEYTLPLGFTEKIKGISEVLEATLEGDPIVVIHFLPLLDIADPTLSSTYAKNLISSPVFPDDLKVNPWCFNVKGVYNALFTQGTESGSFIDFYLKNRMTGLEFIPQKFVSDEL